MEATFFIITIITVAVPPSVIRALGNFSRDKGGGMDGGVHSGIL